eukprot:4755368-Alexandrium_andersonii.AAC.1
MDMEQSAVERSCDALGRESPMGTGHVALLASDRHARLRVAQVCPQWWKSSVPGRSVAARSPTWGGGS